MDLNLNNKSALFLHNNSVVQAGLRNSFYMFGKLTSLSSIVLFSWLDNTTIHHLTIKIIKERLWDWAETFRTSLSCSNLMVSVWGWNMEPGTWKIHYYFAGGVQRWYCIVLTISCISWENVPRQRKQSHPDWSRYISFVFLPDYRITTKSHFKTWNLGNFLFRILFSC